MNLRYALLSEMEYSTVRISSEDRLAFAYFLDSCSRAFSYV